MGIPYGRPDDGKLEVSDEERRKRRAIRDKTTGKALEEGWRSNDRAALEAQVNAMAPPIIYEERCKVCTSAHRGWIEYQLIRGENFSEIARHIPPDEDGNRPSRKSIAHHRREHMAIDRMAIRAELEAQADLLQQNYEDGIESAITEKGVLRVFMRKAYDDVINNVSSVEPKDAIQIIKLLNELNSNQAVLKNEETEAALRIFVRAIQNVCPPEMQVAIAEESKRLREMDEIEFKMEEAFVQRRPTITAEAEVIDEQIPSPE